MRGVGGGVCDGGRGWEGDVVEEGREGCVWWNVKRRGFGVRSNHCISAQIDPYGNR